MRWSGILNLDDKGNVVSIEGVARNITEKKRAAKQLTAYSDHLQELVDERTAELRQSEERFRTLVNSSPGVVYRCQNDANWTMDYQATPPVILLATLNVATPASSIQRSSN